MPLWILLICFVKSTFFVYCLPQSWQSYFILLWILSSWRFKVAFVEKTVLQNKHLFLLSLSMLGFVFDPMINDVKYNIYRTKMKLWHRVFWIKKGASRPYPGQHYGHNGIRAWGTLVVTLENEIGDGPLTFILILKSWMEPWDLLLPSTFSSSNLLPSPSYSSQLLQPPPKPPPNSSYLLLKGLRWLISSYMKRFQCYSAQKSLVGGGGGGDMQL